MFVCWGEGQHRFRQIFNHTTTVSNCNRELNACLTEVSCPAYLMLSYTESHYIYDTRETPRAKGGVNILTFFLSK